MPESSQPFAASHDHSNLDITHDSAIADDDLPELAAEEITDVDLHFGDDHCVSESVKLFCEIIHWHVAEGV